MLQVYLGSTDPRRVLVPRVSLMLIDLAEFVAVFLTGNNLENLICHLCNQCTGLVSDPITETLTVLTTTPLSIVITEAGVAMFKNQPAMVWPYVYMTTEQLTYLKGVVDGLADYSCTDSSRLQRHIQMGGGCIVMIPSSKQHKDVILCNSEVVHAFVNSINKSAHYTQWTKKALSGVIIQRLACTINIPKDTLLSCTAYAEGVFAEQSI
jgi:hypothetical protein